MTPERKAALLISTLYKANADVIETEIDNMITYLRGSNAKVKQYPEHMARALAEKFGYSKDRVKAAIQVAFKEAV